MADQTKILILLAASSEPMGPGDLCAALQPGAPCGPHSSLRKQVINAVGKLISQGLATSAVMRGLGTTTARYSCTDAGRARVAAGKPIKSGPKKSHNGMAHAMPDTLRQRAWEALRLAKKSTLAELTELIHRAGDPEPVKVIDNLRKYFGALSRGGVVIVLGQRARGNAPTSNGFIRYALQRDLGRIAPIAGGKCITDHNARERIPYRTKEKA